MNAVDGSATPSKTLRCGINQGINLGNIKSRIGSVQLKIGFHDQDCLHTILVYFNRRPDTFDIGIINRHGVHSLLCAKHSTAAGTARPPVKGDCWSRGTIETLPDPGTGLFRRLVA
jgi:hypothetical protein